MSDTTQYPDGPYLFTGDDSSGWPHKDRIALLDSGTLQFVGTDWFCGLRDCDIEEFIPLVPSTELDVARQRIAALEAEVERLWKEQWTPVDDSEWGFSFIDPEGTTCVPQDLGREHVLDIWNNRTGLILVLPDNLRLCKRGDA